MAEKKSKKKASETDKKKGAKNTSKASPQAKLTSEQEQFLREYNISHKTLKAAKIDWDILEQIRQHYCDNRDNFETTGSDILNRLRQVHGVHSIKMRVKDPDHLMAKIIRKQAENDISITPDNYTTEITDLIGVRALHLF